jgi:hypothetical protein
MAEHNHPPDFDEVEIAVCRQNMKDRAMKTRDKPCVIYSEAVKALTAGARTKMPPSDAVKRSLRNNKSASYPPVPSALHELTVTDEWSMTGDTARQPFLFFDNGIGATSRIIAFGSDTCLRLLGAAATWFMDGNFAMAPNLFLQV